MNTSNDTVVIKKKTKKSKKALKIIALILAIVIVFSTIATGLFAVGVYFLFFRDKTDYTQLGSNVLVGKFTDRKIDDVDSAILAVKDVADTLNLGNAADELTEIHTNTVDNLTYYRLQQNYKGPNRSGLR